jgi:hypothetical protein
VHGIIKEENERKGRGVLFPVPNPLTARAYAGEGEGPRRSLRGTFHGGRHAATEKEPERREGRVLMLRIDVVEAVEEKKFRIHAIDHLEEGIETLMETKTGEIVQDGSYPEGTFHRLVDDRLAALREASKREEERDRKDKRTEDNR